VVRFASKGGSSILRRHFRNSKIGKTPHYSEDGPGPNGSVMTVEFTLDKVDFVALNGGPQFRFTEAISFSVNCETQDEIDYFWENDLLHHEIKTDTTLPKKH